MQLSQDDLDQAVRENILSRQQADALREMIKRRQLGTEGGFQLATILYYLGALIVLAAMAWLASIGEKQLGRFGLFFISLLYAYLFFHLGWYFWHRTLYRVGGGLLCTLAVCMVPLVVYGWERGMGLWPIQGDFETSAHYQHYLFISHQYWISLEVATLAASIIALFFIRFPFLTAPLTLALWFLVMDSVPLILGEVNEGDKVYQWTLLIFGLFLIISAYLIDRRMPEDFAFWGYLFGITAFSIGLVQILMTDTSEAVKVLYLLANAVLFALAALLNRTIFLIGGAIGIFVYLSHLAYEVFQDSALFPLILSLIGLAIIYLGILYQRYQLRIQKAINRFLPAQWGSLLPHNRHSSQD
ncbi:DUF2157 domain-containing protein [Candidatus Protochlamydia phocaeensis]|uniref:DUF2157 domain-containing protein n=1 Tax=Candidatus Protochlamydia phocaeensis TaxID=1414722 RepID=UPI0008381377|nr:DUF2157 domain-containing protein [Candidatus Protochlamydia phocaeensis]